MQKRILALITATLLALSLCSCDLESIVSGLFNPSGNTGDDLDVGDGTPYADFIAVMKDIKTYGDRTAEMGLKVNSEYYYSLAGASVSAMRYAVEYILWLKGEGDKLTAFTADSRYSGWDLIAEINYSSPYPFYFEGLLLEIQGKKEESLEMYSSACVMPLFPEEGLDFYYLKKADVDTLYKLRDELRAVEETIYTVYSPVLTGRERDWMLFDGEYLIGLSSENVRSGDYETALDYAKLALKAEPFVAASWQNAVFCAVCAEELELAGEYLDEGLAIFPEDESLLALRQMFVSAAARMEAGQ